MLDALVERGVIEVAEVGDEVGGEVVIGHFAGGHRVEEGDGVGGATGECGEGGLALGGRQLSINRENRRWNLEVVNRCQTSQGLAAEVTSKGVYVQAVLPALTRTEIYERAGGDINKLSNVMEAEDLVDAAMVGFDRREAVTIPAVPDVAAWDGFEQARRTLASGFGNAKPAVRYRA